MPKSKSKSKYRVETSDHDSSFESDDGTDYIPDKRLGLGANSDVKHFVSIPAGKYKAVVSPRDPSCVDFDEARTKYRFFKMIYPQKKPYLIKNPETYRLVLPVIPGISYFQLCTKVPSFSFIQQINIFLSAIKALKKAHAAGLVMLDFHLNNIHYDEKTGESFLVDGGLSSYEGTKVPDNFQVSDYGELIENSRNYTHTAPECWHIAHDVIAKKSMDVYSLGATMLLLFKGECFLTIKLLIQPCLSIDPKDRPTLNQLEIRVNELCASFLPYYHPFILAGHKFPSINGPLKEIICGLPHYLIKHLELDLDDSDIDAMKKLVSRLAADENLLEETQQLAVIAVYREYPEVLSYLHQKGFSLNNIWHEGNTLAHIAAEQGHVSILELLANLGVDLNKRNIGGDTPVFVATKKGHSLVIQEFEKQGVNLKSINRVGQTLVHVAAKYGHAHLIDVLAFYGVSLHAASEAGETPIFIAVEHEHIGVLNKLIKHGVKLDRPNVYGVFFPTVDLENGNIQMINKVMPQVLSQKFW